MSRRWAARLLALGGLALVLLIAWLERHSAMRTRLQEGRVLAGLVSLRFRDQGRVVPPALHLFLFHPRTHALEIVHLPPSTPLDDEERRSDTLADVYGRAYGESGSIRDATRAMTEAAEALLTRTGTFPAPDGILLRPALVLQERPGTLPELKGRIVGIVRDPFFWPRLPLRAARIRGLSALDAALLARDLERLEAGRIGLSRLSDTALLPELFMSLEDRLEGRGAEAPQTTVEVLNAAGARGIALRTTKILRWQGFDVVHFGDAPAPEPSMRFIDRSGRPAQAQAVREALGCPPQDAVTMLERGRRIAVTVLVGPDFEGCTRLAAEEG